MFLQRRREPRGKESVFGFCRGGELQRRGGESREQRLETEREGESRECFCRGGEASGCLNREGRRVTRVLQRGGGESRDPRGKESHESVAEEGRREGEANDRNS